LLQTLKGKKEDAATLVELGAREPIPEERLLHHLPGKKRVGAPPARPLRGREEREEPVFVTHGEKKEKGRSTGSNVGLTENTHGKKKKKSPSSSGRGEKGTSYRTERRNKPPVPTSPVKKGEERLRHMCIKGSLEKKKKDSQANLQGGVCKGN